MENPYKQPSPSQWFRGLRAIDAGSKGTLWHFRLRGSLSMITLASFPCSGYLEDRPRNEVAKGLANKCGKEKPNIHKTSSCLLLFLATYMFYRHICFICLLVKSDIKWCNKREEKLRYKIQEIQKTLEKGRLEEEWRERCKRLGESGLSSPAVPPPPPYTISEWATVVCCKGEETLERQ